jgi:hypothetical protein
MSRLNQTIRNIFIRLEAFVSYWFKTFFGLVAGFFSFLGRLSGFSKSEYFVESDQRQSTKPVKAEEPTVTSEASRTRRRPNAKTDDYFLKMAKEVKKG